jgi:hypothetical protein
VGRVFSPRAHCGLNATGATSPKIFGRDITVWVFAPEELRGLNRDGFDVAVGARFAVNKDFELSARWTKLHCPILFRHGGAPRFAHNVYVPAHPACRLHCVIADRMLLSMSDLAIAQRSSVRSGVIGSAPTDGARSGVIGGAYRAYRGAPIGRRERGGWIYSNPCIAWTGRLWVRVC